MKLPLISRIASWFRRPLAQNRYEAGVRWSEKRRWIPGYLQDARYDADAPSIHEIRRKSRYFERNNAIANKLGDLFEEYTVGANGLVILPSSSNEEWNQNAKEDWDQHCKFPDLVSRQTMATLQSLSSRTWFFDGGCLILKTRGETPPFRPRAQLVEYHRLGTPAEYVGDKIVDGVEVDDNGRPVAYWVQTGFKADKYTRIQADYVIHLFEPSRPGLLQGIPFLYPVLLQLHDLDDLWIMEMDAAKMAARFAATINTKSGEFNAEELRRERFSISKSDANGTAGTAGGSSKTRDRFIKEVLGVETINLKENEKLELIASQRPSVMQQWLWEYQAQLICAGVGISKQLVFPSSLQGTVTRADLDTANTFFQSRSAVVAAAWVEYYLYYLDWACQHNPKLANRPPDWNKVATRPPRAVNVDVGRNSAAMLAELAAGATNLKNIFTPLGLDWREETLQRAREIAFLKAAARRVSDETGEDVQPGEIAESLTKQAEQAAQPPQPANGKRWELTT